MLLPHLPARLSNGRREFDARAHPALHCIFARARLNSVVVRARLAVVHVLEPALVAAVVNLPHVARTGRQMLPKLAPDLALFRDAVHIHVLPIANSVLYLAAPRSARAVVQHSAALARAPGAPFAQRAQVTDLNLRLERVRQIPALRVFYAELQLRIDIHVRASDCALLVYSVLPLLRGVALHGHLVREAHLDKE